MAGHPSCVARHHDRGRSDALLAGGDTDQGQAAAGVQIEHCCSNCICLCGAGHHRLRLLVAKPHIDTHGHCCGADIVVGCRVRG